jgi:RimJ/RimL family protein N-acetyltransferase
VTFEQLETPRLVLEPIHESHASSMFAAISDPRLYAYVDERPPPVVEVLEKRYKTWRSSWNENPNDLWLNWAARTRSPEEYVGWFQATVRPRYALIAYVVFTDHQRRGYAREACEAMIGHLVAAYGVGRVRATIDPRNEASIALARSLGMAEIPSDLPELWFELEVTRRRAESADQ